MKKCLGLHDPALGHILVLPQESPLIFEQLE